MLVAITAPVGACVESGIRGTKFDDLDHEPCGIGASKRVLIARKCEHAPLKLTIGISRRGRLAVICRPFCRCLRPDAAAAAVVM